MGRRRTFGRAGTSTVATAVAAVALGMLSGAAPADAVRAQVAPAAVVAVAVTTADPVSRTSARTAFPVSLTAPTTTIPVGVTFDVDWTGGDGIWRPWLRHVAGRTHTFGIAGTLPASTPLTTLSTGVVTTTSVAGHTYRFRVVVIDTLGVASAPLVSGPAVVPFDQTKAVFSSGTPVTKSSIAWLGSYRTLVKAGQTARLSLIGNRFSLVGWRCSLCGVVDIYEGTTKIGSVDTHSVKTVARTVLFTKVWVTVSTRVITVKARGTKGRSSVRIDGFGVRH